MAKSNESLITLLIVLSLLAAFTKYVLWLVGIALIVYFLVWIFRKTENSRWEHSSDDLPKALPVLPDNHVIESIKVPDYLTGESVRMKRWLKSPGESVETDEQIAEMADEFLIYEVCSPFPGMLYEIKLRKGELATPNAEVASIAVLTPPETSESVDPENIPNIKSLSSMDPYDFEHLIYRLCEAMGLKPETTQQSSDGGIDIVAENPAPLVGGTYIIQCKRYEGKVPVEMVRDLYGVVTDERANKGILITTGDFTTAGYNFAEGKPLELINGELLAELLKKYNLLS